MNRPVAAPARLLLLLVLALSFIIIPTTAAAEAPGQDIRLVVETPEYVLDDQGLHVPGLALSDTPGAPRLPIWTATVEIPDGAEWAIVEAGSEEQVLLAPASLPPAPVTELMPDGPLNSFSQDQIESALVVHNQPDPAIYDANALYPSQVVEAGQEGTARGKRLLPLKIYPFQYNPSTGELRHRQRIAVTVHVELRPAGAAATDPVPAGGIPAPAPRGGASLPGLRIRTVERGLYRLTYDAMSGAGAPVATLNPSQIAMWYLGQPIDIEVSGAADGRFDPGDEVLFYAEPYSGRYMTQNVYRLTWSGQAGARMGSLPASPSHAGSPVTTMRSRARVENDRVYYSTYGDLRRDADHFFDNPLFPYTSTLPSGQTDTAVVTYTLTLDNVAAQGDAELRVVVHGGLALADRDPDQSLALRLNGTPLGPYRWDGSVTHVVSHTIPASGLISGTNSLALVASLTQLPGLDKYWVSPDWAELAYPAQTAAKDNRLFIEQAIGDLAAPVDWDVAASGFTATGIAAYDVRDRGHPLRLTGAEDTGGAGGYSILFAGKPGSSYYVATSGGVRTPVGVEFDAASTLGTPANSGDYIAVVQRSLWDAIQPLLGRRAGEGMHVAKVDVQDIYDEFSGGLVDPEAIRSFLSYAYRNWNAGGPPPQYVLLVGDGHFDFKGALRPGLANLIPPYLIDIDPFIGETAADNRYVSIDEDADYLPDMAVGRIPARAPAEVTAVVDKVLAYETGAGGGAWQKRVVFVADDSNDSAGDFHALSEQSRTTLPRGYDPQTIYYNSGPDLDTPAKMKAAIKPAFDSGALYLQWFGHAARTFWGKDKIWELNDPARLSQSPVWPFTAAYSCWAGYFVNVLGSAEYGNDEQSLAEAMLLAPGKSSLADFSPSGLHVGSDLAALNQGLVNALFTDRIDRIGLAVNAAKLSYFARDGSAPDLIDTQVLFGDPATRLRLPPEQVYLPLLRK